MPFISYKYQEFLQEHQKWVRFVLTNFALSAVLGGIAAVYYPELMEKITAGFAKDFGPDPALDFSLVKTIFLRNLTVSLVAWLGGLFLGVIPAIIVFVNGFILGYIIVFVLLSVGSNIESLTFLAYGLVPHGIIEIPAFVVAAVLGLRLGLGWLTERAKGVRLMVLKLSFRQTTAYFLLVILALAAAALVEVFVSGKLVSNL